MKNFAQAFRDISTLLFLSVILFIILNISVYFFYSNSAKDSQWYLDNIINTDASETGLYTLPLSREYVEKNITDLMSLSQLRGGQYEYSPGGIEFINKVFYSGNVNIVTDPIGVPHRKSSTTLLENDIVVFCFGGSTTFGAIVSDHHTWPSSLEKLMNEGDLSKRKVRIFNFGVSGHSPTQETFRLLELLKLGHRPSLVIFMDGVNTGPIYDASEFSGGIAYKFEYEGTNWSDIIDLFRQLPIVSLFAGNQSLTIFQDDDRLVFPTEFGDNYNQIIANRFVHNSRLRKSLCDLYNVALLQFWQPNSYVDYNYTYLSPHSNSVITEEAKRNYREISEMVLKRDSSFINLTYLFGEFRKPALVDGLHYSPDFNYFIASKVKCFIPYHSLKGYHFADKEATGLPFYNRNGSP